MSIVGCAEDFSGRSGGIDKEGVRHYTRTFLVQVDNLQDDALIVTGSGSCIPALYSAYVVSASSDLGAILKETSAKQDSSDPYLWHVTCTYDSGALSRQQSPSSSNDNRAAPDSRPWTISFSNNKSTRLLEKDAFDTPVLNSANLPFDPPLEVPESNPTIKITAFKSTFAFDTMATYQDAINDAAFSIGGVPFPSKTLRVTDYAASSHFDNNSFCWQIDVTLEYKYDGWNPVKVLDAGTVELQDIGGNKQYKQITDATGNAVHHPVPLDGTGVKLAPQGTPYYLTFKPYREESFGGLI